MFAGSSSQMCWIYFQICPDIYSPRPVSLNLSEGWSAAVCRWPPTPDSFQALISSFFPPKPFFLISSAAPHWAPSLFGAGWPGSGCVAMVTRVTLNVSSCDFIKDWLTETGRGGGEGGEVWWWGGADQTEKCAFRCVCDVLPCTRLAVMQGIVYNHSDTRRLGWGWVLPMHNEKFLLGEAASQTQTQPARLSDSVCQEHPWHGATRNKRWSAN